jgi:hypothetical protein
MAQPARSAVSKELRKILFNEEQFEDYVSNSIKTARYNV